MSSLVLPPNSFMPLPRSFSVEYETPPLIERAGVIALVVLLHLAAGAAWLMQPEQAAAAIKEMTVSIAMQQAPVVQPLPEPPPQRPQPRVEHTEMPISQPVVREVAQAVQPVTPVPAVTAPPAVATAPVVDVEPDYKANYLRNPRPSYPMLARKMGWEGRVILNVEVLAEGACGAINVFRSSGREVLDNAAMNTVKGWRFVPARHGGRSVTQWFKVPIEFSLEDNEA